MKYSRTAAALMSLGTTLALFASAPAQAQPQEQAQESPTGSARVALPGDDSLFQALGGQAGVTRLVEDFVPRLSQDVRFAALFKNTKMKRLHDTLVEQICVVAGGPCTYSGDPMDEVHKGQKIDHADFNAVVEILQQSMDAQGIAFRTQGRLLARLAPMHGEIVTR
jgi:hemoglobin